MTDAPPLPASEGRKSGESKVPYEFAARMFEDERWERIESSNCSSKYLLILSNYSKLEQLGLAREAFASRIRGNSDSMTAMMMGLWTEIYYPAGEFGHRFTVRFGTDTPGNLFACNTKLFQQEKRKLDSRSPLQRGKRRPLRVHSFAGCKAEILLLGLHVRSVALSGKF